MRTGSTPNFARTPSASRTTCARRSTCTTCASTTDWARSLSGVQIRTCSTSSSSAARRGGGGERVVRLVLGHRPDGDAHRRQRLLERLELEPQRGVDAGARLVAVPELVPERLDHVVGGDADVRAVLLEVLEHGVQHARGGAVAAVVAAATPAVEVTEELVGAVEEVDDHRGHEDGRPAPPAAA